MKTLLFLFSMSLCSLMSHAQFNTVNARSRIYKVVAADDPSIEEPSTANHTFVEKREDCTQVDSLQDVRRQLISQYISVSYPLKQIQVNSSFGQRRDPFTGKKHQHNGLDLQASQDEVYSMLQGSVVKVGFDKRSGIYVTMKHGDYTVSYCHLSKASVQKGDWVNAGEVIGLSGSTGRSTGEHLHLGCKYKGQPINPTIILDYIRETQAECLDKLKAIG